MRIWTSLEGGPLWPVRLSRLVRPKCPLHLTKLLCPVPLFCILLSRTITKRTVAWVESGKPECTVPLGTWNFRNFKPEFLLNGKRPAFSLVALKGKREKDKVEIRERRWPISNSVWSASINSLLVDLMQASVEFREFYRLVVYNGNACLEAVLANLRKQPTFCDATNSFPPMNVWGTSAKKLHTDVMSLPCRQFSSGWVMAWGQVAPKSSHPKPESRRRKVLVKSPEILSCSATS